MWDATTYEAFREARHQPFEDLLARVPLPTDHVGSVLDAGCGTGKNTLLLAQRYAHAAVLGVDSSERMLMHAPTGPRLRFLQEDLATWSPGEHYDLVVSNAVLHWIPEPERVLRRIARWVAPSGVLAVQVPANFEAASHQATREAAKAHGIDVEAGDHVLPVAAYRSLLEEDGFEVDAWQATYVHALSGADPVLKWLSGTTLRPYVQESSPAQAKAFLADLAQRLRQAYPPEEGVVRFPFTRTFFVGVRRSS